MAEITWSVSELERTGDADKIVTTVGYRIEGVDGDYRTAAQLSMNFTEGDASAEGFIAFDSLTEEDVLGWVKAKLGDDEVIRVETAINARIEQLKTPAKVKEIPWAAE